MQHIIGIIGLAIALMWSLAQAGRDAKAGKALYAPCAACHGQQGEGNPVLNAPALAGQEDWYVARQLRLFKAGLRGADPRDTFGLQMRPMAMTLATEQAIEDVAAYISTLPPIYTKRTLDGDPKAGQEHYLVCVSCHGEKAEGNRTFNAPALAPQHDWYLLTQLKNFKAGIRGQSPKDTYGRQMQPMTADLVDEQALKDVIAYIKSLAP